MHCTPAPLDDWPVIAPRLEMLELAYFAVFDRAPPSGAGQDEASRGLALQQALDHGVPLPPRGMAFAPAMAQAS